MDDALLLENAWLTREFAQPWKSGTKVGCVIETNTGDVLRGWNLEGLWMTSIHAEVSAIAKLLPHSGKIKRVVIVAETSNFTPCGACLDWLFQFADKDCTVITQNKDREIRKYKLAELCPHYPIQ